MLSFLQWKIPENEDWGINSKSSAILSCCFNRFRPIPTIKQTLVLQSFFQIIQWQISGKHISIYNIPFSLCNVHYISLYHVFLCAFPVKEVPVPFRSRLRVKETARRLQGLASEMGCNGTKNDLFDRPVLQECARYRPVYRSWYGYRYIMIHIHIYIFCMLYIVMYCYITTSSGQQSQLLIHWSTHLHSRPGKEILMVCQGLGQVSVCEWKQRTNQNRHVACIKTKSSTKEWSMGRRCAFLGTQHFQEILPT